MGELWTDRKGRKSRVMDEENNKLLTERWGPALPLYVIFKSDGTEIGSIGGRPSVDEFVKFLQKGLDPAAAKK